MKQPFLYILALLLICVNARAQQTAFKTDGFYFYDNHVDTMFLVKITTPYGKYFGNKLTKDGINTNGSSCLPAGTIPIGNSSFMRMISFFSNDAGTTFNEVCWNKSVSDRCTTSMKKRKQNFLTEGKFSKLESDQAFRVRMGKNNNFIIDVGPPGKVSQRLQGKLFPDRIVIFKITYPEMPAAAQAAFAETKTKVFKYYRFDKLPPERSKLIYVYKNPIL